MAATPRVLRSSVAAILRASASTIFNLDISASTKCGRSPTCVWEKSRMRANSSRVHRPFHQISKVSGGKKRTRCSLTQTSDSAAPRVLDSTTSPLSSRRHKVYEFRRFGNVNRSLVNSTKLMRYVNRQAGILHCARRNTRTLAAEIDGDARTHGKRRIHRRHNPGKSVQVCRG
jgi:hypothetical protein